MQNLDDKIREQVVNIGDSEYTFGELFFISEEINEEFTNQAARFAYLGMLMARAEAAHDEAKANRERVYAKAYLDIRHDYDVAREKYTEAKLSAEVLEDEDYQQALNKERVLHLEYRMLRTVVDAMRQRGEMLISLGAQLRQEYDVTNLSISQMKRKLDV